MWVCMRTITNISIFTHIFTSVCVWMYAFVHWIFHGKKNFFLREEQEGREIIAKFFPQFRLVGAHLVDGCSGNHSWALKLNQQKENKQTTTTATHHNILTAMFMCVSFHYYHSFHHHYIMIGSMSIWCFFSWCDPIGPKYECGSNRWLLYQI